MASRYLDAQVRRDLRKKMVFVAGPRQVGKTTLAKALPGAAKGYLNWDVAVDRDRILRGELPASRLWIFDEIHKYRSWRALLKGLTTTLIGRWSAMMRRASRTALPRTC